MIIRGKLLGRAAAVAGVVLALVSTGIAQASVPQSETRSGVSGTGIKYVALGDSRASGPRLEPMYPDACSRSYENFAGKISRALEVAEFTDVSCSAARAENIIDTPQLIPNYWPVQLDAVHPDTDLITISIGGNDSNSIFLGPPVRRSGARNRSWMPVRPAREFRRPIRNRPGCRRIGSHPDCGHAARA